MKPFFRIVLGTLGTIAIFAGIAGSIGAYFASTAEGTWLGLFILTVFGFVPLGIGYELMLWAERLEKTPVYRASSESPIYRLGLGLTLFFILVAAACMPLTGRIIVAVLLFLVFTRIHRGWSSRKFSTPLGKTSWAKIFDGTVIGIAYVGFRLLIELLFAALTGGKSVGFTGGGGSSGGGGASGRW